MSWMIRAAVVSSFAALSIACAAAPAGEGVASEPEETLGQAQQEQKADPLFPSICRACGCKMETVVIDGCNVSRCVCTDEKGPECIDKAPPPPKSASLGGANDIGGTWTPPRNVSINIGAIGTATIDPSP